MISETMQVKLKPAKSSRSYETTVPMLTMPRGSGFSSTGNALAAEEVKHFRLWNFIAISIVANKVSEYFPNLSIVGGQTAPTEGRQYSAVRQQHAFNTYRSVLQAAMPEDIKPAPENHPLNQLFRKVNSMEWWSVFVYEMIVFKRLTGVNYLWAIPNGAGKPAAMWNIPPQWVDPPDGVRNKQTGLVTGWKVVPEGDTSREITIPAEEVIPWKSVNPESKRLPLSPLRATSEWTDSQEAIEQARTMTFKNGPLPSVLVETPDAGVDNDWYLDDTFYRQASEKFIQRWSGTHKAGIPLIAPPGYRYKPWSLTPKEMDFNQSSAQVRDMILAQHGVPKLIAGITEDINRASALAALEVFCRETIQPILQDLAGLLTETLAAKFDPRLKVWFDDCVPRDNEAFRADVEMLFRSGAASPEWIGAQYGIELPDEPAYKQTYIPIGMVPLGEERPTENNPPPPAPDDEEDDDGGSDDPAEELDEDVDDGDAAASQNGSGLAAHAGNGHVTGLWLPERQLWKPGAPAAGTSQATLQQRRSSRVHNEFLRRQAAWEKRAGSQLRRFWTSLTEDVRQRLERAPGTPDVDNLLPDREFEDAFNRVMEPVWAAMAADGAKFELRNLNASGATQGVQGAVYEGPIRLDAELPDIFVGIDAKAQRTIRSFLRQRAAGIWKLIRETAKTAMRSAISKGLVAGDSIPQIRQRIIDKLNVSRQQATRIARTEATGSLNAGAQAVREAEQVEQKIWMSTADDVTRTGVFDHVSPDGQIVKNDDAFSVSGEELMYPGDASGSAGNIVNCFLPGTKIAGRVMAAVRSFYCGQAVEIVTRRGMVLRVTKNHPVLTEHGFVPAGSLEHGDQVLSHVGQIDQPVLHAGLVAAVLEPNEDHEPTAIEQVFGALASVVPAEHRWAMPGDFHGDGQFVEGDIEIVRVDRRLLAATEPGGADDVGDLGLELSDAMLSGVHGRGPLTTLAAGVAATATLTPRRAELPLHAGSVSPHRSPLEFLRFGSAASIDAGVPNESRNHAARDVELARQLILRSAGDVLRDQIVGIRKFDFRGHVYDVQSPLGWVSADGVVCSNCRCTSTAYVEL